MQNIKYAKKIEEFKGKSSLTATLENLTHKNIITQYVAIIKFSLAKHQSDIHFLIICQKPYYTVPPLLAYRRQPQGS